VQDQLKPRRRGRQDGSVSTTSEQEAYDPCKTPKSPSNNAARLPMRAIASFMEVKRSRSNSNAGEASLMPGGGTRTSSATSEGSGKGT
jgi:hypothetical protein